MSSLTYVPGEGSDRPTFMIVGEAPGPQEEIKGRPFIGRSGDLLRYCLSRKGIREDEIYITNVCHFRPPNNDIRKFAPVSKKHWRKPNELVVHGMVELYKDIARLKPKVILPVGNLALWALFGQEKISRWRGSVLQANIDTYRLNFVSPFFTLNEMQEVFSQLLVQKLVPTWHPAAVSRQYNLKPIMEFDFARAKREALTTNIIRPERTIYIDPPESTALNLASQLLQSPRFAFDIETPRGKFYCISFSSDPSWALVLRTNSLWKMELIRQLLNSPIPKVAHNGLFDTTFLEHHHDLHVEGYDYDTMYWMKLYYPEFKVGLDFQTSFFTDEPYYKDEGKDLDLSIADNEEQYLNYCGKDSCLTIECYNAHMKLEYKRHQSAVESRTKLLPICRKMMLRQLRVDYDVMIQLRQESEARRAVAQEKLDTMVLQSCLHAAEKGNTDAHQLAVRVMKEVKEGRPGFNVNSSPDVQTYLYKIKGLKAKYHKKTKNITAEETALKELYGETGDDSLLQIVKVRQEVKLQSTYLVPKVAPNGRLVYSVNPVGTKTARWTSGQSIVVLVPSQKKRHKVKTGVNVQTLPPEIRKMVIADEGMMMFYADLSQVEDRIVAYAGGVIKKIHAFEHDIDAHALTAAGIFGTTVEEVLREAKQYKSNGATPPMRYLGKQSNHAYNYGEGARTFKLNVNKKADETGVRITEAQAKLMRAAHFKLYPEIEYGYWTFIKEQARYMKVTNPFGEHRTFLGRPRDEATYRDMYSWYPQSTAPEIINRSMIRIFDALPEVELLSHGHDAILGQVPEDRVDVLKPLILELMIEPLKIHDRTITIPVDIKFGKTWGGLG